MEKFTQAIEKGANKMRRELAMEILGRYAYYGQNPNHAEFESRINSTIKFIKNNPNKNVSLLVNNNWSMPPHPKGLEKYERIGGTTYRYQLWLAIEK